MLEEDTLDAGELVLLQPGDDLLDRADKLVLLAEEHDRVVVPAAQLEPSSCPVEHLPRIAADHAGGHQREGDRLAPGLLAGIDDPGSSLAALLGCGERGVFLVRP